MVSTRHCGGLSDSKGVYSQLEDGKKKKSSEKRRNEEGRLAFSSPFLRKGSDFSGDAVREVLAQRWLQWGSVGISEQVNQSGTALGRMLGDKRKSPLGTGHPGNW